MSRSGGIARIAALSMVAVMTLLGGGGAAAQDPAPVVGVGETVRHSDFGRAIDVAVSEILPVASELENEDGTVARPHDEDAEFLAFRVSYRTEDEGARYHEDDWKVLADGEQLDIFANAPPWVGPQPNLELFGDLEPGVTLTAWVAFEVPRDSALSIRYQPTFAPGPVFEVEVPRAGATAAPFLGASPTPSPSPTQAPNATAPPSLPPDLAAILPTELLGQPLTSQRIPTDALAANRGFSALLDAIGRTADEIVVGGASNDTNTMPRIFITLISAPGVPGEKLLEATLALRPHPSSVQSIAGRRLVVLHPPSDYPSYLYTADGLLVDVSSPDEALVTAAFEAMVLPEPATSAAPSASPRSSEPTAGSGALQLAGTRDLAIPGAVILSMSPDGGSLLDASSVRWPERVCVAATATLIPLACVERASLETGVRLDDVAWSPDGTKVAFAEDWPMLVSDGDLWLLDVATGTLTNLDDDGYTGSLVGDDRGTATVTAPLAPAFSPDGRTIAFSRTVFGPDGNRTDIATVPVEGGPVETVATVADGSSAIVLGIGWAPDGTRLYYALSRTSSDDQSAGVWALDFQTGTTSQVSPATAGSQPWLLDVSADGRWLLVAETPGAALPAFAVVDTTSGGRHAVALPGSPSPLVDGAVLSPDGRMLLAVSQASAPGGQVFAGPIDGELAGIGADGFGLQIPPSPQLGPTWATNGTVLLTGARGGGPTTLLTIE